METLIQLLELLAPVIAALVAQLAFEWVQKASGLIENAPAWLKRVLVVVIAFGLGKLSVALNVVLPDSLSGITLENIEALAAAGLAFAFHAGDKAKSVSPTTLKLLVFLTLFSMPALAACEAPQQGSATVTVIDRSQLRVDVSPRTFRGEVGDTITFTAVAVDTVTADTIPVIFRWTSTDPTGVSVDNLSGKATLLRAGEYQVTAEVQRIVALLIMRQQDDGSFREVFTEERQPYYATTGVVPPSLSLVVGETALLCAYAYTETEEYYAVPAEWESSNPEVVTVENTGDFSLCPTWEPGMPFPQAQAYRLPSYDMFRRGVQVG